MRSQKLSNRQLEERYDSADYRLNQERSDFLLPQIVDFVRDRQWITLRPVYQRRLVWNNKKKSLLIESLLLNVPIPPVFLYEHDLSRYEVMDGQQRLNTIVEFYENRLKLSGLERWAPLNGKTYSDCPPRIRRGLDRRRISATVLLAESTISNQGSDDLRKLVFERLNTGGQNLNPQELRNCLFSGKFNDLIMELAGNRLFNEIWDIPPYEDNIRGSHVSKELMGNRYYKRMGDCEIVLRFFAMLKKSRIKGSMKKILDSCMESHARDDEETIDELRDRFLTRLKIAHDIFGAGLFRIKRQGQKQSMLSIPLYDSVMVALDRLYEQRNPLRRESKHIKASLKTFLADDDQYDLIVGRANTAGAIRERQDAIEDLLSEFI